MTDPTSRPSPPIAGGPPDTDSMPLDSESAQGSPGRDSELTPWSDSDVPLAVGPAVAFAKHATSAAEDQMPTVGHIGRYALKYPIGEGGLGTVYAAHDPLLSRVIAIKTLNLELPQAHRETFQQLFLDEARAAAGLNHPHIVTVHDAGVDGQGAYVAMELLKGRDLRLLRQEGWRPTHLQAALIVRRVADALAYAHSRGVLHLDVKPANIFMVGRTHPKLLDFGMARVAQHCEALLHGDAAGASAEAGAGLPHYLAPEQVRHEDVDRRTDVFALGVVLYELLTDRKPFTGQTVSEIAQAVLESDPPPAHEVDPTVPRPLSEIAQRAMQKDPQARYRSPRSMARDLRHWLNEHAQATDTAEDVPSPPSAAARGFGLLGWGAVAALALTVSSVVWVLASRDTPGSATRDARQGTVVGGLVQETAGAASSASVAPRPAEAGTSPTASAAAAALTLAEPVVSASAAAAPAPAGAVTGTAVRREPPAPTPGGSAPASSPAATVSRTTAATARRDAPRDRAGTAAATAASAAPARAPAAAAPATGEVRIAVSPWGSVEVDGIGQGIAPPLTLLRLPEGRHEIVIRNADFPPFVATVVVRAGEPVTVRHRFGS